MRVKASTRKSLVPRPRAGPGNDIMGPGSMEYCPCIRHNKAAPGADLLPFHPFQRSVDGESLLMQALTVPDLCLVFKDTG